jgi:asparagine synthase (glutamine-hydrolysing)
LVDATLWETVTRLVRGGHGVGKQEMARVPVVPLPPAILARRKTGFSVPVREWLHAGASTHGSAMSRGLRGWALLLYRHAGFGDLLAARSA